MPPIISVILPNYNYQRYLRERFRSILHQTELQFELIYLDDGSTDKSNDIANEFAADPRVQIVLHTENSGRVYQRWNEGAQLAGGKWLWFAGADDSAEPQFLEALLGSVTKDESVAIAHCRTVRMDGEGRIVADRWTGDPDVMELLSRSGIIRGVDAVGMLTGGCFLVSASAMLIRRDAFLAQGGFDARLRQSADWKLYLKLMKDHSISFVDRPLATYRVHTQAVTSSTNVTVRILEDLYALASAWNWVRTDPRISETVRSQVERRVQAKLFDFFTDPKVTPSANLRFAVDEISDILPDRRWKDAIERMELAEKTV